MRVAINQPYFCPYAGWFRLLSCADLFVIYDDVSFIKGGYIHRNRLERTDGVTDWLTLPIKRPSLGTLIKDMEWQPDSCETWKTDSRRFKAFKRDKYPDNYLSFFVYYLQPADARMDCNKNTPLQFIAKSIEAACYDLQIGGGVPLKPNIVYSSSMSIPPELKGQDRVLWICDALGADTYVNAPGGRHLYEESEFAQHGIDLKFLCDYPKKESILDRLNKENPQDIRKDIDAYCTFD